MNWDIPWFKIHWDKQDVAAITGAIKRGMNWAVGPDIQEFETGLAHYIGRDYAVTFSSGTSALHAILAAYGTDKGAEVIVPSFTFIATANAPLFVGAKPIFAEIEQKTYGLDPQDVERRITSKTKAILPIHYGGCPCLIKELRQVADKYRLLLIEDAAEAFGADIGDRKVGTFGDAAVLSFCQNKIITTGEGGAVLTNCKEIYDKLRLFRSHGRLEGKDYFASIGYKDYVSLGYNFRLSNIAAALGVAQLEKASKIIDMRRHNAEYLSQKLCQIREIQIPTIPEGYTHVYQVYTIRLKDNGSLRDKLAQYLATRGIMSKIYFYPVHLTHFYRQEFGYRGGGLPVTEKIASEVLTLPMYPDLTRGEMDYIVEEIGNFFEDEGK